MFNITTTKSSKISSSMNASNNYKTSVFIVVIPMITKTKKLINSMKTATTKQKHFVLKKCNKCKGKQILIR